jgi:hypothetical protein
MARVFDLTDIFELVIYIGLTQKEERREDSNWAGFARVEI